MATSYCHMPSVGTWITGVGASNEAIATDMADSPVTKETPLADFLRFDEAIATDMADSPVTKETPLADFLRFDESFDVGSPCTKNAMDLMDFNEAAEPRDVDAKTAVENLPPMVENHQVFEALAEQAAVEELEAKQLAEEAGAEMSLALQLANTQAEQAHAEVSSPKASGGSISSSPTPQSSELKPIAKPTAKVIAKATAKVAVGTKELQNKGVAPIKKVQKAAVSTPAVSKVAAGIKEPQSKSVVPVKKVSEKVQKPVVSTPAVSKVSPRASTPTRKAPEETASKCAAGSSKPTGQTSPRQTSPRQTSPRRVPALTRTASTSKVTKPVEVTSTLRTSKSTSAIKMEGADVNTAPPISPRPSPPASRTAQTPKREAPQTSTVTEEFRTPRKSSTQVPTSERLTQLAQAHKPKSMTSNELEALAIQKACEDARRLREKNARAVGRQAAARALAATQENTAETPQPNTTETSGKRSPLRTRPAGNEEIVSAKTKTTAAAQVSTEASKENRSLDHTVGKMANGKKSPVSSAPQRPSAPLAKKSGPVVAATRA